MFLKGDIHRFLSNAEHFLGHEGPEILYFKEGKLFYVTSGIMLCNYGPFVVSEYSSHDWLIPATIC